MASTRITRHGDDGRARARASVLARATALCAATAVAVTASCAATVLAGCGGSQPAARAAVPAVPTAPAAPAASPGPAPARAPLRVQVAGAFRQGLARMAVQDQPTDEAADLGQDLPTGRVRHVRCDARGSVRSTCVVDWLPVSGAAERTVLEVRARPDGCWDARPRPVLRSRYDATIASYAEHPLNVLSSVRPGC